MVLNGLDRPKQEIDQVTPLVSSLLDRDPTYAATVHAELRTHAAELRVPKLPLFQTCVLMIVTLSTQLGTDGLTLNMIDTIITLKLNNYINHSKGKLSFSI